MSLTPLSKPLFDQKRRIMIKYVFKRLLYMVIVFFLISFLVYCLFGLVPNDPAALEVEPLRDQLDPIAFEQVYQEARARMGLDDPLGIRYLRWLGLYPDVEAIPNINLDTITKEMFVQDVIPNPTETAFIKELRRRGIPCATGAGMLINQAALNIEMWTGQKPDKNVMYKALEEALS